MRPFPVCIALILHLWPSISIIVPHENILSGELIQRIQRLLAEGGITIEGQQSGAIDYLGAVIHAQAATLGYQDAFLIICFVFIATLIPAWVLKKTM